MKKLERIFGLFFITLSLFFLNPIIFGDPARAEAHFMEALAIVKFDPKIEAQNFLLPDLNGDKVSLAGQRGKVVFLNFWATWCPPCRYEMPSMEKLYNKFKNNDFTILAVNLGENVKQVKAFKESYKLSFPILLDADSSVGSIYGAMSIPITYLIDRDGYLRGAALGPRDWASEEAFGLIDSLLKITPNS
ncbi:MAG: TlpA family protein disulfide reductase [Desulfobacterales bacterium]|nr:MAG: TlpA family protein disulfide reductase [Desulfobacterales bacterium]